MTTPQTTAAPLGWPRYSLILVALAVAGWAQWNIFQLGIDTPWSVNIAYVAAAFMAAWALGRPESFGVVEREWPIPAPASRGRLVAGLLVTLVGTAASIAGTYMLSVRWTPWFEEGFGLLAIGVPVASAGLAMIDVRFRRPVPKVEWLRLEFLLFFGIVALGFFLRFYRYDYFPPPDGVCAVEEPQSGQGALIILKGLRPWEFMLDRWMPIIGMKLIGNSFPAIRLPFTVMSWITIIPLYLLMRELVSRPAALFATLLFAFCRWHLMYARLAHAIFGPTLPIILFDLWLCVRVYKRGGLALYPWIGVLSALPLFAYAGYRATCAFIGVFFLIASAHQIWRWRSGASEGVRASARRAALIQFGGYGLALGGFLLLVVPLIFQILLYPQFFVEAAIRATDNSTYYTADTAAYWAQRINRIRETAMMFNHFGDGSPTFNLPGTPQLDPISGLLFLVGLFYCVIWGAYRFQGYFAFYFITLLGFGTVFVHNFDIRRLQGIIPLIFVMVGFAADRFGRATIERLGDRGKVLIAGLAVLLCGASFYDNYRVYFIEMIHSHSVRQSFHNAYTVGIAYMKTMPDNGYMYLVSDHANFFLPSDFEWVRGSRIPGKQSNDLLPLFLGKRGPWSGKELHIVMADTFYEVPELSELIRWRFPDADCQPFNFPDQHPYASYTACVVRGDQREGEPFQGGLLARYYRGDATHPFLERFEPAISYGMMPDECRMPRAEAKPKCRAEWEGYWTVDREGDYTVLADIRRGDLQIKIGETAMGYPGRENSDQDQTSQQIVRLAPGRHKFVAKARFANPEFTGARVRFRAAGEPQWHLMRFADDPK